VTTPDQPPYRAIAGERPCGDPACVCVAPQPPTLPTVDRTAYERGIFDAGVAAGRRQATEGWEREWGVTSGDGDPRGINGGPLGLRDSEEDAQRMAARVAGRTVVSRLVGPWEPAEQTQPTTHARGCMCGWNDAGQRFNDPICRGQ